MGDRKCCRGCDHEPGEHEELRFIARVDATMRPILQKALDKYHKRLGFKVDPHPLRATFDVEAVDDEFSKAMTAIAEYLHAPRKWQPVRPRRPRRRKAKRAA